MSHLSEHIECAGHRVADAIKHLAYAAAIAADEGNESAAVSIRDHIKLLANQGVELDHLAVRHTNLTEALERMLGATAGEVCS